MRVERISDFIYFLFLFAVCIGQAFFLFVPQLQVFRLFIFFLLFFIFILKYRIKNQNLNVGILFFLNSYYLYMFLISIWHIRISIEDFFNLIMLIFMTNLFFFLTARNLKKSILIFCTFTSYFLVISFSLALIELLYGYHLPGSRIESNYFLINVSTGFYTNENDFSVVIFLILFLRLCIKEELLFRKMNFFDLLLIILSLLVFAVNGARLSLLSSLLIIFFLFFFRLPFSTKMLFLGVCLILLYRNYLIIVERFIEEFSNRGSNEIRLNLILTGLESIYKYNNFLGYGINQSSYYYKNVLQTGKFLDGIINPHAYLIEILLNSGIVFFLLFIIADMYLVVSFYKRKKYLFSIFSILYFWVLMSSSSSLFLWPHYLCFFMLFVSKKFIGLERRYKN